jgi:uncharacterized protein YlxP (DUF503 family)
MSGQPPLFVAVGQVELHLPGARSLKEKRHDVRSLVERLRHRFSVLVIESNHQDLHQRAALAITALATDGGVARAVVDRAVDHVHETFPGVVLGQSVTVHQVG